MIKVKIFLLTGPNTFSTMSEYNRQSLYFTISGAKSYIDMKVLVAENSSMNVAKTIPNTAKAFGVAIHPEPIAELI